MNIDETLENFLSEAAAMESQPVIENADADVVQEENAGAATESTGDDVAGAATGSTEDGVQVEDAVADEVTRGRGENAGAATGSTGDDVAGAATGSTGDGVQVEDAVADVVNKGRGRKLKRKKGQAEDANVVSRPLTRAQHKKQGICAPTNQLQ
uniref:Uncharacterized protein n=1 Tax=Tanacetum cinerariifolium TaxID=118510 RepID=A0A6L2J8P6_TANCI|nr:hypothetical protein [Tanacetum cinerariifolium]